VTFLYVCRLLLVILFMLGSFLFPIVRLICCKKILKRVSVKNSLVAKLPHQKLLLVIPYILATFFILFPVESWFPVPGSDAWQYVYYIFYCKEVGLIRIFQLKRPFVALILTLLTYIVIDWRISLVIFKVISGFILVLGVYNFCSRLGISYTAKIIGLSLATLLPAQYLRHSYDLYASFFAYSLLFVLWYQVLEALDSNSVKKSVQTGFIFTLIAFSHFETFLVNFAIMLLYLMITCFYAFSQHKKHDILRYIKILTISIVIPVIFLLPFAYMSLTNPFYIGVTSKFIGPLDTRLLGRRIIFSDVLPVKDLFEDPFWGIDPFQDYIINRFKGHTNFALLFLTLIGLYMLNLHQEEGRILYAWNTLLIVGGALFLFKIIPVGGARWLFLLPLPILLCLGVDALFSISKSITGFRVILKTSLAKQRTLFISMQKIMFLFIIIILLHSTMVAITIKETFNIVWAPDMETIQKIECLRNIYGYGNDSVILIVRDNWKNKYYWTFALTGMKIYFGDTIYLIANRTINKELVERFGPLYVDCWENLWRSGVLENPTNYTIVLTDILSPPNEIEKTFVVERCPGIYEVDIKKALNVTMNYYNVR